MLRLRKEEAGVSLIELLVVMVILGIVTTATMTMVLATQRAERYQDEMQTVVDDGRQSLSQLRKELREARRILPDSDGDELRAWVDHNVDTIPQPDEIVCYGVEPLPGAAAGQFQIVRWTGAVDPGCDPATDVPAGVSTNVVARTLVNDLAAEPPFNDYDPDPSSDPSDPETRTISLLLRFEVLNGRGPESLLVEGTVRLRNVA